MDIDKQKKFLVRFAFIAILLLLSYFALKYAMPVIMPFFLGFVIAAGLQRTVRFIQRKTKLNKKFLSVVILILFYATIGSLLVLLVWKFGQFIKDMFNLLPSFYVESIKPGIDNFVNWILGLLPKTDGRLMLWIEKAEEGLLSAVTTVSASVVGYVTELATRVPSVFVKMIFTIIASFFFILDYDQIMAFVYRQFSEKFKELLYRIKHSGIKTIAQLFKAYVMIMCVTFAEVALGLIIIGIDNAIPIAFMIAVVDIVPVLGTGTVLIPWSVIAFFTGKIGIGAGMLILYVVVTIIRQIVEPRLVGKEIGLHPVVTLLCMYVGVQLFGFIGLFLLPITMTIIKTLNDDGIIHLYK